MSVESREELIIREPLKYFARSVITFVPTSILPSVFALLAAAYFTRVFPPAEYGLYSLALAIATPLSTLLGEWIAQPAVRYYADFKSRDQLGLYYTAIAVALVIVVSITLVAGSIFMLLFPEISLRELAPEATLSTSVVLYLVVQPIFLVGIRILPVKLENKLYTMVIVLASAFSVGIAYVMVTFFGKNVGWLMWGAALSVLLVLPFVIYRSGLSQFQITRKQWGEIKSSLRLFWRYGSPFIIWFLATGLLSQGDRYIIQIFRSSAEIGIYSVNYNLAAQAVGLINTPIMVAIFPILTHQWSSNHRDGAQTSLARITEIYLILGMTLIMGAAILGKPLAELILGRDFWAGAIVLVPVTIGLVVYGLGVIGHKALEMSESTQKMAVFAFLAAILNIVLNLIFIPPIGYLAGAYTTLVSYAAYVIMIWFYSRRIFMWQISWRIVLMIIISAVLAFVLSVYAGRYISGSVMRASIVRFVLFLVSYSGLLYVFRVVRTENS